MLQQPPSSPDSGTATPKLWECDVCTKSFTTKYFLKKHKRLHTGEMPYTCEICARTFTFQQSYHKHLLYHSEVKPHVCVVCGRAFKELSTLHNHQRIHSGEKPFKCEVCGGYRLYFLALCIFVQSKYPKRDERFKFTMSISIVNGLNWTNS